MISVVIPNKNKADYLSACLDSLLSQSDHCWEAIVVDDASTDLSVEIIRRYIGRDDRFHLIELDCSVGGSAARNVGLGKCRGSYVIFLDSDDILAPQCLGNRRKVIESDLAIDFVVFPMCNFTDSFDNKGRIWAPKSGEDHLKLFLRHQLPWQTMQPIWRKAFVQEVGGFDPELPRFQDVDLHTRALLKPEVRYRVSDLVEPDCFYRIFPLEQRSDYKFMMRWTLGAETYLRKTTQRIKQGPEAISASLLLNLRVTLIATVGHLFAQYDCGNITKLEREKLLRILEREVVSTLLDSHSSRTLFYLYRLLARNGFLRVRGVNFTFRKLVTL